jgi:undecaprenyl-diphosphatase
MWFADIGEAIAWTATALWALVVAVPLVARRTAFGRTLAPVLRVPVLVGSAITAMLLIGQAIVVDAVADHGRPGRADWGVWAWFVDHRAAPVTFLMKAVTLAGDIPQMAVLAAVVAGLLWRARRGPEAAVVLGSAVGAWLLIAGFKDLYGRVRPPVAERLMVETNPALPSGHALGSIVVLGVLAAVVVLTTRRVALRAGAVALAVVGVLVIGVSRLYLGVHWFTDVVTGWLLGGAWLAMCVTVLCVLERRRAEAAVPSVAAPVG